MRAWVVSQSKAGTLTQCLGVAQQIDPSPYQVIINRKLKRWRSGLLSPYRQMKSDEPDVIISCGRMAERHVLALARQFARRPYLVHLQTPVKSNWDRFHKLCVSRHDWTSEKAENVNFSSMIGVPHRITKEGLLALRGPARHKHLKDRGKCIAVLIGGTNHAYSYDEATITDLLESIKKLEDDGWTVLATTSRRSEPRILQSLIDRQSETLIVWNRKGENPYQDYLAAADAFLVTKDTITMHCEAVATERPVFTFDLAKKPCEKLQTFEWFHHDMSETLGLTRPFAGQIYDYSYSAPREAERLGTMIRDEVTERKRNAESTAR